VENMIGQEKSSHPVFTQCGEPSKGFEKKIKRVWSLFFQSFLFITRVWGGEIQKQNFSWYLHLSLTVYVIKIMLDLPLKNRLVLKFALY